MRDIIEYLEDRIKQSLLYIERDKNLIIRFKGLSVKAGDVVYHQQHGKGIINNFKVLEGFHMSPPDIKTITEHTILAVCGFVSLGKGLEHVEVDANDLILYNKITETLYD